MPSVTVLVLAPAAALQAGPLERVLDAARATLADRHREAFLAAGADRVIVHRGPPDDTPFGTRLRRLLADLAPELRGGGIVVLGATAIPLATDADRRDLVEAARDTRPQALANQRHSADAVAIARAMDVLRELPDLDADNALPRWLAEVAGIPVRDLAGRRRLAMDVDSPLDLLLLDGTLPSAWAEAAMRNMPERDTFPVRTRLAALRELAADPTAELLVAGRTSAADLRWLELRTRSRTRALVEERGLRVIGAAALLDRPNRRPPRSVLGALLERDGPESLGRHVSELADGALIDSRVLLAHRLGADEHRWPVPEDRYASDLLLADRVGDPWLRALTAAAAGAPAPIMLGGHSLVGPGLRLALRQPTRRHEPARRRPRAGGAPGEAS